MNSPINDRVPKLASRPGLRMEVLGVRKWPSSSALLAVANLLVPAAVLIFATGFFPYKPFVPGLAEYEQLQYGDPPAPHFDKVIFMVVDALRSDFVFSNNSGFRFTQSLVRSGEALPFTAHATSPTITMPRVKAITTGSIPSFLDVILNFAESDTTSTLASQDTWLAQIKDKKEGKLVMYGDDTWLKLFPDTFSRADGTSSFFVSDFTEVDNNVTRHVPHELRVDDWNAMIMHYLGLDHIGHKAGPLSPNMIPKQLEMDGIVEEIYSAMTTMTHLKDTLLVLCGDHGMNDGGNHGGSAPGETSPALVFMSPKLKTISSGHPCPTEPRQDFEYYTMVEQSDIAPTLAGLLGFPVPLNNLGVFIEDFLPLWKNPIDQTQLLLRNAMQILKIVKATFPNEVYDDTTKELDCESTSSSGVELACLWRNATNKDPVDDAAHSQVEKSLQSLFKFCRSAQDTMSSTASNYNVSRLVSGIAVAATSVVLVLFATWGQTLLTQWDGVFFILVLALYGIMMFASSYVEEEQHFWYWISGGWLAYLKFRKSQDKLFQSPKAALKGNNGFYFIALFLVHRITQRWNQTGQKFAGAPDIVHDVLMPYPIILWTLIVLTYLVLLYRIGTHASYHLKAGAPIGTACAIMLCVPAFAFKLGFTASDAPELLSWLGEDAVASLQRLPLVGSARLIFLTLTSEMVWAFASRSKFNEEQISKKDLITTLHTLTTLFLITQTRATNIPLYLLFLAQSSLLSRMRLTPVQITVSTLLLGHVSFFALGNSNAISSIDLSNAYNGVSGYNVLAVGVLVFLSNWAGPIWWSIAGIKMLVHASFGDEKPTTDEKKGGKPVRSWVHAELQNLLPRESNPSSNTSSPNAARKAKQSPFVTHITLLSLFTTTSLLAVMVACTLLRTHLFIWTVFSPKYLYAMAWSLAFHLLISIGVGGGLWWVCGS